MSLVMAGPGTAPTGVQVVCTLAERRYFLGVGALVNSLVRAGFAGIVVVGYRGAPPAWLDGFARDAGADGVQITPQIRLRLLEIGGPWHLNNCKPRLIATIFGELYPEADLVYYFDTDMVITHAWGTFSGWVRQGVVMALDAADTYMPPHHVYRREWQALAARRGHACREVTGYVNGGCIGISRAHAAFVAVWQGLMEELEATGADMARMKNSTGKLEFSRMDQDVLNATIMATDTPLALLGSEAMGMFPWVNEIMPHAMWQRKPWDRNYIVDALRGFPPGRTHLAYWRFVDGPIRPFSRYDLLRKRLQLAVGRTIGLLHIRSFRDL